MGIGPNPQFHKFVSDLFILNQYFKYFLKKCLKLKVYIRSHTVVELYNKDYFKENNIKNEYNIVIVDDCFTCSEKILPILENMVGKKIPFNNISIVDKNALEESLKKHKIYALIHFAGKKAVDESVENPLLYYENMKFFVRFFLEIV